MTQVNIPYAFRELLTPSRFKAYFGGRGSGKCVRANTPIVMANGSQKMVQDVVVGDQVMGPDSTPRNVLGTTSGFGPMYHVKQKTGEDYVVNDAHILSFEKAQSAKNDKGEKSPAGDYRRPRGRYPGYGDIANIPVTEYEGKSERFKNHFLGYKRGYELPEKEHRLDPYFLGLWLGDGTEVRPEITNMDPEVLDWVHKFAADKGWPVNVRRKPFNKAVGLVLGSKDLEKNGAIGYLGGLIGNKHIPEEFFQTSQAVRLKLLAGLIDSDGHVKASGSIEISQSRMYLLKSIKRLADSLGFKTSMRYKEAVCKGKLFDSYRLHIGGNINRIPCLIERKRTALDAIRKNKDWRRTRVDVEPLGDGEYFGFELDGDHLFLLGDGTVTHNSWSVAYALVLLGFQSKKRILCCREIQKSIGSSVKQLLEDVIVKCGMEDFYESTQYSIKGKNGTQFTFAGLRSNPDSVKSTEGLNIVWVEEANTVSKKSIELLTPTVRQEGSEIWFTWNRTSTKDPVDHLFLGSDTPPPDTILRKVNWDDNPFFPEVLYDEMMWDKSRDIDKWRHVWEGEPIVRSEARVFNNWRVEDIDKHIPDKNAPRLGADWGFSVDPTVLIECYVWDRTLYFRREAFKVRCEIDETPALFAGTDTRDPKRWDNRADHPGFASVRKGHRIVADSARPETISYLKNRGFDIVKARKGTGSVEEGVEFMKSFDIVVHPDCKHLLDELAYYSYREDLLTGDILPILEDKHNHVIDAARYALEGTRKSQSGSIAMFGPEVINCSV